MGRLPWVGVSWDGLRGGWWVVGALLGPEGTGMGGSRLCGWVPCCVCCLVGPACCHTASVLVVLFWGLLVFVVGGGVGWCLFVV